LKGAFHVMQGSGKAQYPHLQKKGGKGDGCYRKGKGRRERITYRGFSPGRKRGRDPGRFVKQKDYSAASRNRGRGGF